MDTANDPIKHVVVLMLENHSFDQMLGSLQEVYPGLDGVDAQHPHSNTDDKGVVYTQLSTTERQVLIDPYHNLEDVAEQLAGGNSGFMRNFVRQNPDSTPEERQFVMGYYPLDFLPALHTLARQFLICDRWFCSVPGPTWPNRFMAMTGTASGRVDMPEDGKHWLDIKGWFEQDQTTIFDRLNEKGISWKVYFHDVPISLVLMHQRSPENASRYFSFEQFQKDAAGSAESFPSFSLIEPDYQGFNQNDDHPPHDLMRAQKLLADTYNALRANEQLWKSTLLVVLYDEHGGFYDHVVPPSAVPPDDQHADYTFDRLGPRVPALLVSPWVQAGFDSTVFDHTSVLKYLIDKWGLGPLGKRTAAANSIAPLLARIDSPRLDTVAKIELTDEQAQPPNPDMDQKASNCVTDHHRSLVLLEHFLFEAIDEEAPRIFVWFAKLIMNVRGWFWSLCHRKPAEEADIIRRYQELEEAIRQFLARSRQSATPPS
jgi:phospholipase C